MHKPAMNQTGENEQWYDDEISPALLEIANRCAARGMSLVAVVEFGSSTDPADPTRGGTYSLTKNAGLAMHMLRLCGLSGENIDKYIINLLRHCTTHGINTNSSIFLHQFGRADKKMIGIETLAKELHEAGRAAVIAGATVAAEKFGETTRKFLEWDEITDLAREGRRIQAKYLSDKYNITPLTEGPTLTCVYCGMAYPQGTPTHGAQILTDHIKVCEKHPLRKAEADIVKLRSALSGLVGSVEHSELEQMEAAMRLVPASDSDKAVSINAIRALLETAPPHQPAPKA